jgi:hypothetical protein
MPTAPTTRNLLRVPHGHYGAKYFPIGKITVPASTRVDRSYETASWWREVECPEQTVTLWCNGYMTRYQLRGVRTASYFGAYSHGDGQIGQPDTFFVSDYAYNTLREIYDGTTAYTVELLPDYEVEIEALPNSHDASRPHRMGRLLFTNVRYDGGVHALACVEDYKRRFHDQTAEWSSEREKHVHDLFIRGVYAGSIVVAKGQGFNGDTSQAAMYEAERLYGDRIF